MSIVDRERILRKHGAEVEQDRDYLVASWFVDWAPGAWSSRPRCAVLLVVGASEIEEIELEYVAYAHSVTHLEKLAQVLTSAAAAAREIEAEATR